MSNMKFLLTDKIWFGQFYVGAKVWIAVLDSPSYFEYCIREIPDFAIKDLEYMIPVTKILRQHGGNIDDLPKGKYSEKEIEVYSSIAMDIIPDNTEEKKPNERIFSIKEHLYIHPHCLKMNKERCDKWWK